MVTFSFFMFSIRYARFIRMDMVDRAATNNPETFWVEEGCSLHHLKCCIINAIVFGGAGKRSLKIVRPSKQSEPSEYMQIILPPTAFVILVKAQWFPLYLDGDCQYCTLGLFLGIRVLFEGGAVKRVTLKAADQ